jgi:hypothetical protein
MLHTEYKYRVPIESALDLQIRKSCLRWQLTDDAESDAIDKGVTVDGQSFASDSECEAKISVEDGDLVVRFYTPRE